MRHSTHAPLPSHILPLFSVQARPDAAATLAGVPALQTSSVQVFPSSSGSLSSSCVDSPPSPSQRMTLQSPAVWIVAGMPAATNATPQTPSVHVRVWQPVSVPGHSEASLQPPAPPVPPVPPVPRPPVPPVPRPPPTPSGILLRSTAVNSSQPMMVVAATSRGASRAVSLIIPESSRCSHDRGARLACAALRRAPRRALPHRRPRALPRARSTGSRRP